MSAALAELQRIGIKIFAADGVSVRPRELIPIFHRWIQTGALADQLLIDVADYDHVPQGPGVVLVAHEGIFSVDLADDRMGLAYTRKAPVAGSLGDRLRDVARTVLNACRLLEEDAALGGRLRFRGDEMHIFANDRLLAPNTAESLAALQSALRELVGAAYGDADCAITPDADRRERLGVRVRAPQAIEIAELSRRLG